MTNFKKMVAAIAMLVVMSFSVMAEPGILLGDRSGILVSDKNAQCVVKEDTTVTDLGGILVSDLVGILLVGRDAGILLVGKDANTGCNR
jgi:hypothetical protein